LESLFPRSRLVVLNPPRHSKAAVLALLGLALIVCMATGLANGASHLSWSEVWREEGMARTILWEIRVPRVFLGCLVGAGMAVSGACLQAFFRNPLADPGLIGVSSGAALGAVLCLTVWFPLLASSPALFMPVIAVAFGIGTTLLIYGLSRVDGRIRAVTFLLCGIAVNALVAALIAFLIFRSNDQQLRSVTFWMMGSLGHAGWKEVLAAAPLILISLAALPWLAKPLNAFLLGEAEARHLGVRVETLKRAVVFVSAASVGAGVAVSGMIGFVGLVVPHLVRLMLGADHRWLLPGSALLGAVLLVLSDLVARVAVAPAELPLGVITALFGAPFFLWLLLRERGKVVF
jgi:iron complex transport system permease protein